VGVVAGVGTDMVGAEPGGEEDGRRRIEWMEGKDRKWSPRKMIGRIFILMMGFWRCLRDG